MTMSLGRKKFIMLALLSTALITSCKESGKRNSAGSSGGGTVSTTEHPETSSSHGLVPSNTNIYDYVGQAQNNPSTNQPQVDSHLEGKVTYSELKAAGVQMDCEVLLELKSLCAANNTVTGPGCGDVHLEINHRPCLQP